MLAVVGDSERVVVVFAGPAHFVEMEKVPADAPRVIREEAAGDADKEEGEENQDAVGLDGRKADNEDELEHIHQPVEGVLDPVDDPSLHFLDVLLKQLGHH